MCGVLLLILHAVNVGADKQIGGREGLQPHTLGDSSADKYSHGFKYISCQTHSLAQTRAHTHTRRLTCLCVCLFFFLPNFCNFLSGSAPLYFLFSAQGRQSARLGFWLSGRSGRKSLFLFVFGQCLTTEEEGGVSQFSRVNAVFLFRVGGPLSGRLFILCSAAVKICWIN